MAEFDPNAPHEVLSSPAAFDPGKPFEAVGEDAIRQYKKDLSWTEVGKSAVKHIPESAGEFAKNMVQPILHPVDTIENIGNLGLGALQKSGIVSGSSHEKYADAVGQFIKDRYGNVENFKRTLARDPVGIASDISIVFSGGGMAAAKAPGMIGKIGEAARTVGAAIDPLTAAGKAIGKTAKFGVSRVGDVVGDLGIHTGATPLRYAAEAGYKGDNAAKSFQDNLRGKVPVESAVQDAEAALKVMKEERGKDYRSGMKDISKDKTVLSFSDVDNAVNNVVKKYKGVSVSDSTGTVQNKIRKIVEDWRELNPSEYHTPEGFDALKQALGDVVKSEEYGSPARLAADKVYHAVRDTIKTQAPEYSKVMKGYEEATDQIKEIEKTLSLNPNATIDTSLRKLQSTLRDNVNTSYGRRKELAEFLMKSGADNLMYKLAGQALQPAFARSLGRLGATIGAELLLMQHGGAGGLAMAAATLPFMSPRVMGEAAYYGGKAAKGASYVPPRGTGQALFQAGRLNSPLDSMTDNALGQ